MENSKTKVMLGVIPGYGHENKELTPSDAYEIGIKTWEEATEEVSNKQSDLEDIESSKLYNIGGKVIPAIAVYSRNFACPEGGEVGIQVESSISEGQDPELYRQSVIETVKVAMGKLSQTTTTIEWPKGSTYISEGGKNINENDSLEGIEQFSVSLGDGTFSNKELLRVGSAIQNAMDIVSSTRTGNEDEKYYMISGVMTPSKDGGISFSASQNPIYGQTSNELYKQSVKKTIEMVMKELGQKEATINFGNEDISLNLKDQKELDDYERE